MVLMASNDKKNIFEKVEPKEPKPIKLQKPTFWDERLAESFKKNKNNPKKFWELCSLMVYKYKLDLKIRGVPASMIAYKILEKHGEKLTKEEKEFLGEVLSG